jgi:NAD(P)-dependent dehydrogenase (short-subunit alcohol dehydrogenase family)
MRRHCPCASVQPRAPSKVRSSSYSLTVSCSATRARSASASCCRAVVPHMREKAYGKIVNISSSRVWEGVPNRLHYTTSKAGVIGLTRALCKEVGFCLHPKGEKRVLEALPNGLDAATRAVFDAEGVDFASATGDLRRAVRDCLKANLPQA